MSFEFHKLHSLGNDFVIILAKPDQALFSTALIQQVADRHRGVGFDQLMWVSAASGNESADYNVRIFNSDGSESGQCVNGMRSVGYLLQSKVNPKKTSWILQAGGVDYEVMQTGEHEYGLQLDAPILSPSDVPFVADKQQDLYDLTLDEGLAVPIGVVSVGNPHAVWRVQNANSDAATEVAYSIAEHAAFPAGVNVGVCYVKADDHIFLQVLERGAGWTQACGSGAIAAATVSRINHWTKSNTITVTQPGGDVKVSWPSDGLAVSICGPVVWVYNGGWCGD
ncbi:MAG: diaminopimelate epimerase [Coxiellaceae bacterium]|nr:diaminopimelate epimerase [Coxiellaceae bacterium]